MEAQTPKTEFNPTDYIKNQFKYLGFGEDEKMHKDLEAGIKGENNQFKVHTTSDKVMKDNKADFTLNFNKTDKGGIFLNSYEAKVTTRNGEERSHTFKVRKENNVTAKEAINLLEGRAVKVALERKNDNGEVAKENVFIKLKLKDEKTEYNNYKLEMYKEKDINIGDILKKSNIQGDEKQLETVKHHLEKGNITSVSFKQNNKDIQGYAVLNPQYKMLNLYDNNMSRVNTNKDSQKMNMEGQEKNNVREQSQKRTL